MACRKFKSSYAEGSKLKGPSIGLKGQWETFRLFLGLTSQIGCMTCIATGLQQAQSSCWTFAIWHRQLHMPHHEVAHAHYDARRVLTQL